MDSNETEVRIARDYYTSPLSIKEMSRKYRMAGDFAVRISERFDYRQFKKEADYCVIKVERGQMAAARLLLENANINYDIPERFEMTEYCESKINYQTLEEL